VDVAVGAVQVQQIVDSVMAMAEVCLAMVMVADVEGWATVAVLTYELHTPYLTAKYSGQVENACKRVRTEHTPLFWDGWSWDKQSQCSTLLSLDCNQSLKRTTS
jgi:acyl-coenzyme A thioesterase PaaI-like protein